MSDVSQGPHQEPEASSKIVYVALLGMLATGFGFTILTVALGLIADEFGISKAVAAWTVSVPMLISAVCLPLIGKLGDMHGHRRLFIIGIAGSTIFSALCFVAWDIWSLIVFRVLTMVFAGATTPSAMALIFHSYTAQRRTQAISWWSMGGPGSAAIGLIVGGPLVDFWGWRSVFIFQIVVGVIAFVFALRLLPETPKRKAVFDHLGNATLIIALCFLMFAAGSLSEEGVSSFVRWSSVVLGLTGLVLFYQIERRVADPIAPPSLLKARNFSAPVATSFLIQAAYLGGLIATPMVLVGHFGYSISVAAAMMLLRTMSLTIASPISGQISTHFGERFAAVSGVLIQGAGLMLVGVGVLFTSVGILVAGLVLQGIGHGFALPPLSSIISTAAPASQFGAAAGLSKLVGQIGSSFGLSLFGVLLAYPADQMGLPMIFTIGGVLTLLGVLPAAMILSSGRVRAG